ncbi:hypothetical protein LINGRAHAP2_LOCUS38221 [Linum grandiflorum]
MLLMKIVKKFS